MKSDLILCILFLSQSSFGSVTLTLSEALSKAQAAHPDLRISDYEHRATLARLNEERAAFYPTFGLEGGYQKFDSDEENTSGQFGNIFGEYRFDLGLSSYFQFRAAALDLDLARLNRDRIRRQLQWSTETLFSRALYLQESLKIYHAALEQNKNYAQMAKKKKSSGLASDADVIEFDLNNAILRSDMEDLKSQLSEALLDLKIALGIGSDETIELSGPLEHFHISENLQDLTNRLTKTSYQLRQAELEAQKADYLKTAHYGRFLPEISLRATYGRRGMDEPAGPEETYSVVARWEIFSGLGDLSGRRHAVAMQEKAKFIKRQTTLHLPGQLESEYKKFMALQNRVDLESQNRLRSQVYLKTVMNEYRRGVKNSADLKSASLQLLESSLRDLKYRYEGIRQKEVLQTLLGDQIHFEVYTTNHKVHDHTH